MSEKKVRILTVIDQYYPFLGGAENVARFLVENTNNAEYENNVLTVATSRIVSLIDDPSNIQLEVVGCTDDAYEIHRFRLFTLRGREKNGRIFRYFTLLKYILNIIKLRDQYDLIHAHTYYWPAMASVIAGRLLRKPVIITGHNRISRLAAEIEKSSYPRVMLNSLKRVNSYVAISKEIQFEAEHLCKLNLNKITLLYNGIDTKQYYPCRSFDVKQSIRTELGLPRDKVLIIYHGRLEKHKNIVTLLNALAACDKHRIVLLVIGEGSYKQEIEACVHDLELADCVSLLGFKKNTADYLRASDIYCLPSHLEGFSLALLEGMASGLVCLASDIEGNSDAINNSINGYLFDPNSVEHLAELLNKAITDIGGDELREISIAARNTVVENFSLTAMLENYKKLYRRVLGCSSSQDSS